MYIKPRNSRDVNATILWNSRLLYLTSTTNNTTSKLVEGPPHTEGVRVQAMKWKMTRDKAYRDRVKTYEMNWIKNLWFPMPTQLFTQGQW